MPRTDANFHLFWLQDCVWKGWTSSTRSQYLSVLFPIPKKKGPARYQIRCSCHSRPAAEVREGDPEAEAGPPEEKPGPRQDFVAKKYCTTSKTLRPDKSWVVPVVPRAQCVYPPTSFKFVTGILGVDRNYTPDVFWNGLKNPPSNDHKSEKDTRWALQMGWNN